MWCHGGQVSVPKQRNGGHVGMQTFSFVQVEKQGYWSREWKQSIGSLRNDDCFGKGNVTAQECNWLKMVVLHHGARILTHFFDVLQIKQRAKTKFQVLTTIWANSSEQLIFYLIFEGGGSATKLLLWTSSKSFLEFLKLYSYPFSPSVFYSFVWFDLQPYLVNHVNKTENA